MRTDRFGLHSRGVGRTGLAALRGLAASAMLLGTIAVGASSAGAQADEDEGTYEAPTFGYTLEWDADRWSVEEDVEASENGGRDFLALTDADGAFILFVEGSEDSWKDTDDCVETLYEEIDLDPADGEVVENEDGDPFELSEDNHSRNAVLIDAELSDGSTQEQVVLVDCYADPDSDLIVGFTSRSGITEDYGTDGYPVLQPIIESLPFADASGNGSDDEDATPVADDDETPVADDDETPVADDETPEARGGDSGLDGNVYTSPTYDFVIEFDEDVWTVEDESSDDDIDTLVLSSDTLTATVTGFNTADGVEGCTDFYLDLLNDRGEGDAEFVTNQDTGDELIFPSDDGSQYEAYYFYTADGDDMAAYMLCVDLGGGDVLGVDFSSDPATLADDASSDLIDDFLQGVSF
jgi:hypothetical protein